MLGFDLDKMLFNIPAGRHEKEDIIKIAGGGAELLKRLTEKDGGNYRFEYS